MFGNYLQTTTGCVVGGAGPAGMGLLFNALRTGTIAELARYGLIIVDASPAPGIGRLGDYQITANSVGDVFLDCLRDPAMAKVFAPLQSSAAYWRIRDQAQEAPLLSEVGTLLFEASQLVLDYIVAHYSVQLWSETLITEVICERDQYHIWVEHRGKVQRICSRALVLNLGGRQDPQRLLDGLKAQGPRPGAAAHAINPQCRQPAAHVASSTARRLRAGGGRRRQLHRDRRLAQCLLDAGKHCRGAGAHRA